MAAIKGKRIKVYMTLTVEEGVSLAAAKERLKEAVDIWTLKAKDRLMAVTAIKMELADK